MVDASENDGTFEITADQIAVVTNDGKQHVAAESYFVIPHDDTLRLASPIATQKVSSLQRLLTNEGMDLIEAAKADMDRLSGGQREVYVDAWAAFLSQTWLKSELQQDDAANQEWLRRFRAYVGALTNQQLVQVPLFSAIDVYKGSHQYFSADKSVTLKLADDKRKQTRWNDWLALLGWVLPLTLLSLANLPSSLGSNLRFILEEYPWRLLCILAVVIALLPNAIWFSLAIGGLGLALSVIYFARLSMESS